MSPSQECNVLHCPAHNSLPVSSWSSTAVDWGTCFHDVAPFFLGFPNFCFPLRANWNTVSHVEGLNADRSLIKYPEIIVLFRRSVLLSLVTLSTTVTLGDCSLFCSFTVYTHSSSVIMSTLSGKEVVDSVYVLVGSKCVPLSHIAHRSCKVLRYKKKVQKKRLVPN